MTAADVLKVVRARTLAKTGEARRIREAAGVTLRMVSDAVGVSEGTVSRWETGERAPRAGHALAWIELLDALVAQADELAAA